MAHLNPGRQWIGINNIILDEKFQPRAETDKKWVSELEGHRRDGSEFPPIKVFQLPDGRLVAASGFHRTAAAQSAGEAQILCDVEDGTEEDAIVFAAGSNKGNGVKPMSPKDITRAAEMLLSLDSYWDRSDTDIANHIGCSPPKITKIRSRISARDNKPLPDKVFNKNGVPVSYRRNMGNGPRAISRANRGTCQSVYKGTRVRGKHQEDVQRRMEKLATDETNRCSLVRKLYKDLTMYMGFTSIFGNHPGFKAIRAYYRPGIVCRPCDFSSNDSLPSAIGSLVAGRRRKDPNARVVVVCYAEDGPEKLIEVYRQDGFEFMTPSQLEEDIQSSGKRQDESA